MQQQSSAYKPRLWVPGDWNAFFGLGTNVLLNVLVLSGLALFVIKLPNDIVYGRILPALGIALPIGNLYYAYLAYRLARKEGRDDVAAMPYGPSVPHYFFVTFVIMLPVVIKTNGDVLKSWEAGLAWAFFIGIVVLTVIGWLSHFVFGWHGLDPKAVGDSFAQFGIHLPRPGTEVISGLTDVAPLLATAIPLGVYNFTEGMNNVESASAAGDNYNLRNILLADGIGAVV